LAELGNIIKFDINEFDGKMRMTGLEEMCKTMPTREDLWRLIRSLELLIEVESFDINAKDSDGMTALHLFIQQYSYDNIIDLLRFLIVEKGAEVNSKNARGATAIHILFLYYRHDNLIDVAQFLIEHGGDITSKTPKGLDAFHFLCLNKAIYHNHDNFLRFVRWLKCNGGDVNQQCSDDGSTAFHLLCQDNSNNDKSFLELVQFLIEEGFDVTIKNFEGCTALHYLCEFYAHSNLINLVRLLIGKGIDVNAKIATDGSKALHCLCQYYSHDNLIDLV